ncbi:MAG: PhoH family protein [Spirochaetales bacterium]|jgi:PhoH-like ATPase|nr:PhoH family protein [Spirochaetales bacterium]
MGKEIKTFVIDTNVLIHKADAILSFRDNEVVVPLWVLEELDKLKTFSDERGRNARHAIRWLAEVSSHGDLGQGVKLDNGSILRVVHHYSPDFALELQPDKVDNKILMCALTLQKEGKQVFFVSKDINARVKAKALGIRAVDYEKQKVNINSLYAGWRPSDATSERIEELITTGSIQWPDRLHPNEFIMMQEANGEGKALGRFNPRTGMLEYVPDLEKAVSGIFPLNDEQRMAFDLLLDDSIKLVTLVGKAGTGKTLLSIAAGLKMVLDGDSFSRVLVSRPVVPMGKDIGYLPGAKSEKLSHWMQPLFDNLEYILSVYRREKMKSVDALINNKLIEIEALTYIRGRSLPNQFIIIDEAQNLSPHEIKTIVSRAGEGTKVVLSGDPYQIDSPYLDSNSNGLTYLVEVFKGQDIFGHMLLVKSERSTLAELAAELL